MYSVTHESVTVPVSRDRKIRTALRANQITGFVTVPSDKNIKLSITCSLLQLNLAFISIHFRNYSLSFERQ